MLHTLERSCVKIRFSAASTYHFTTSLDNHHMCVILYGDRILINIVIRFSAASTYILSYHCITTTVIPLTSTILVSLFLWEAKAINILSMLNMKLKQLSMAPNYLGHIFFFSYLERGGRDRDGKDIVFCILGYNIPSLRYHQLYKSASPPSRLVPL